MKKLFYLLFVITLSGCGSNDDAVEDLLIQEILSTLESDDELFWTKVTNQPNSQPSECVYKWFQNGYVYSERCNRLWSRPNQPDGCIQDWYYQFPLDEISILNETADKIVFSYRDKIYEVILSNDGKTVQLKYNNNPNYIFITNKITNSKLTQWIEWRNLPKCN